MTGLGRNCSITETLGCRLQVGTTKRNRMGNREQTRSAVSELRLFGA